MKFATLLAIALLGTSLSASASKAPSDCTSASGTTVKQTAASCPSGYTAAKRTPTPTTPATTAEATGPSKPTFRTKVAPPAKK
jgi:hypothetical protein